MQTLRKLPTMLPKTNSTNDQNSNGMACQGESSNINLLLQRPAHDTQRRGFVRPYLQRPRALMQQHAKAVGRATAGGFRRFEQRRLRRAIDHVVNGACLLE